MTDDPRIAELARFTYEKQLTPGYGDCYLFFVGRDDVHGVLKWILVSERLGLKLSMFGYDDDELNNIIMRMMGNEKISVQASLDKRQAGGVHERALIELDKKLDPITFGNSFVITNSPSGQILHTKGGVCTGTGVAFEGSTNWSASGEGTGTDEGVTHVKAQSNTLLVTVNPVLVARFTANLDSEHRIAVARQRISP
jgi:hypothetical protein